VLQLKEEKTEIAKAFEVITKSKPLTQHIRHNNQSEQLQDNMARKLNKVPS